MCVMHDEAHSKSFWTSPTLLSQFLAPDLPLCSEAIYHRLLSCELRQQSCLVFLEQLKLQAETLVLLHFLFQGMQTSLAEGQTERQYKRSAAICHVRQMEKQLDRFKTMQSQRCLVNTQAELS